MSAAGSFIRVRRALTCAQFQAYNDRFPHGARANLMRGETNQGLNLEWIFEAHRYR
jgi:hypothetical protein